jgi:hypothetical protein
MKNKETVSPSPLPTGDAVVAMLKFFRLDVWSFLRTHLSFLIR